MASLTFLRQIADKVVALALREDIGSGDLTSRTLLPAGARVCAAIIAKQPGIVAGTAFCPRVFRLVDRRIRCRILRRDGQPVRRGQPILRVEGPARSVLTAERTAVNILGHLCGVATLTAQFVQRGRPYPAIILDTRKTLPGLRVLEKYAVRMGGGRNHRMGLYDAVLIKTNHLRALQGSSPQSTVHSPQLIARAITKAKQIRPRRFVEIEVKNLREFRAALQAAPDAILLDNWPVAHIKRAACLTRRPPLEASGNVTLRNIRRIAATGVERISIGCLTHSAPALDLSLKVESVR